MQSPYSHTSRTVYQSHDFFRFPSLVNIKPNKGVIYFFTLLSILGYRKIPRQLVFFALCLSNGGIKLQKKKIQDLFFPSSIVTYGAQGTDPEYLFGGTHHGRVVA